jgi:hypothetical protein
LEEFGAVELQYLGALSALARGCNAYVVRSGSSSNLDCSSDLLLCRRLPLSPEAASGRGKEGRRGKRKGRI